MALHIIPVIPRCYPLTCEVGSVFRCGARMWWHPSQLRRDLREYDAFSPLNTFIRCGFPPEATRRANFWDVVVDRIIAGNASRDDWEQRRNVGAVAKTTTRSVNSAGPSLNYGKMLERFRPIVHLFSQAGLTRIGYLREHHACNRSPEKRASGLF